MSYTYNQPVGGVWPDEISHARYLVGDTLPKAPYSLTDAEIQYELAVNDSFTQASANVAYIMGDRYSDEAVTSKSVGNLSISRDYGSLAARFHAKATALRSGRNRGKVGAPIWTGSGTSPQFYLGQFDND